jgi:hypothetical protein
VRRDRQILALKEGRVPVRREWNTEALLTSGVMYEKRGKLIF